MLINDHRNRRIRKTVQRLNTTIAPPHPSSDIASQCSLRSGDMSPPVGVHEWETQETHTFVWDGNNIVFEKVEFANGTIRTFEYFWGADKSGSEQGAGGVEGLLAVSVDGVFYIPCYDHNGNIILYISETGSIAAQYTYDPYGNVIDTYGNLADVFSFGFSTQYHDRETGMVGYQQRFYSPVLGRWLNRDPIGEKGGLSLYAMCQNNAIAKYDILGLSWTINRDSSKRWATARRSSSKDTFEELAQKLKLETSESSKWLKPKGNDTCTFDIPNVFCVYTSKSGWWDGVITFVTHLKRVAMADSERYKAAGFMVIAHEWAISEDAFYSMWTQDGIYAISFAGHGSKYGFIADKDSDSAIGPDAVRPPYKLSAIRAYSCLSSVDIQGNIILPDGTTPSHSWRELVSSTGTFFGYSGSVNWISQFWQEVSINEESN